MPNGADTRFDELYLWLLEDSALPRLVAELRLVDKGMSLRYASTWLQSGFPLSEDQPLVDIEHLPLGRAAAVGAVDDARPDRWGERVIQYIDRPRCLSLMEYLYFAGDERFGAMGVSTPAQDYLPRKVGPLPRLQSAKALSEIVSKINVKEPISELERTMVASGGSFDGAKPNALIEIGGEQWVIKFFNNEPIDVPFVEHATTALCAKAGVTVAETRLVPLIGENAIAVRRPPGVGIGDEGRDSTLSNAMSQCTLFGLTAAEAAIEVSRVIQIVDGWKEHFTACGVCLADVEALAQRIDGEELLSQRQGFRADEYSGTLQKRRRSPFRNE